MFGKLCKHKKELLAGDKSRLFDESEESTLREIHALAQRAPEIIQLSNQIAEYEQIAKAEQTKLKKAKKNLGATLGHGVEINAS